MSPAQEKGYFLELNEYFLLAARTSSLGGPHVIEELREAPLESEATVGQVLSNVFPATKKETARAICALRPRLRFFHLAEDSETRRYSTPAALRAFVSQSAPAGSDDGTIVGIQAGSGVPLSGSGTVEGRWILEGSRRDCLAAMHATVREWKLAPCRVEAASLAMAGAVLADLQFNKSPSPVLVWEIGETTSDLFLIGSTGLMAAKRLPFGFDKVAASVQAEIHLKSKESAAKMFFNEFCDFAEIGPKIASRISPLLQSEAVELIPAKVRASVALLCTGLPSKQAWFGDHLARSLGFAPWKPDVVGWCRRAGLNFVGNTLQASLTPVWLGLLGVISATEAGKPEAEIAWHPVWNCNGQTPDAGDASVAAAAPPRKPEPAPAPAVPETVRPSVSPAALPSEKVVTAADNPPPPPAAAPATLPPAGVAPVLHPAAAENLSPIPDAKSAASVQAPVRATTHAPPSPPPAEAASVNASATANSPAPKRPATGENVTTPGVTPASPDPAPVRPVVTASPVAALGPKVVDTVAGAPTPPPAPAKIQDVAATPSVGKPARAARRAPAKPSAATAKPASPTASPAATQEPKCGAATPAATRSVSTPLPPPSAKDPAIAAPAVSDPPGVVAQKSATGPEKKDPPAEPTPAPAPSPAARRQPRTPIQGTPAADPASPIAAAQRPTRAPVAGEPPAHRRPFLKTPAGFAVFASIVMLLGAAIYLYRQSAEEKEAALRAAAVAEQHAAAEATARRLAEQQTKVETEARRRAEEEIARKNAAAEAARRQAAEEMRLREIETNRLLNGRGSLTVATDPPGATIDISNLAPRVSPATITDLRLGHYAVKISLAGFEPADLDVEIKDGETTVPGPIRLVRQTGSLALSSKPAGISFKVRPADTSLVAIAVLRQGTTPAVLADVPTGQYTVIFSRDGWPDHTADVAIDSKGTAQASAEFPGGSVTITSVPAGASVTRNDRVLGVAPLTLENQAPGEAGFNLELKGFASAAVTGRIEPEKTLLLTATLIPDDSVASIADLDERPVPIKTVEPTIDLYPGQLGGEVTIVLTIDRDGTPKDLKVEHAPSAQLGRSCLAAAAQWRFSPGKIKGIPVKTRVVLPFTIATP